MIIECSSCGARYKYDESKLEGASGKKVKCAKCKNVIDIVNPNSEGHGMDRTFTTKPGDAPPAPQEVPAAPKPKVLKATTQVKQEALSGKVIAEAPGKMPENRKISLAVISGNNSGEIFQIAKTKMTIGRGEDADILIQDLESSRHHARIDVMGDRVVLRDLNSTNGTFMNEQKITATNLENHSEFRIGTSIFMLIVTDLD